MMNRVNFGRLSGTVIDVCRGHGTFLDGGELHAIVTFIHRGRARSRPRSAKKTNLEEEAALGSRRLKRTASQSASARLPGLRRSPGLQRSLSSDAGDLRPVNLA